MTETSLCTGRSPRDTYPRASSARGAPEAQPHESIPVCTHGWVVDGQGRQMHKSLGNQIFPEEIIKDFGADVLRLWVASLDYHNDIRVSKDMLKQLSESYRKIRNTARYILGNLGDSKGFNLTISR